MRYLHHSYNLPSTALPRLFYEITNRKWSNVLQRCKTHPKEALSRDRSENTPLHLACKDPTVPLNVLQEMIKISNPLAQNQDGCLPIHLKCTRRSSSSNSEPPSSFSSNSDSSSADSKVISTLLEYIEKATTNNPITDNCSSNGGGSNSGSIPYLSEDEDSGASPNTFEFHSFERIRKNKNSTFQTKTTKRTPLHYACMSGGFRGIDVEAFQTLVVSSRKIFGKDVVLWEDIKGDTAISLLCKRYKGRIQNLLQKFRTNECLSIQDCRAIESDLGDFWNKIHILLKAVTDNKKCELKDNDDEEQENNLMDDDFFCVHACMSLGKKCPNELLELVLYLKSEQIRVFDEAGNIPLHLAVKNHKFEKKKKKVQTNNKVNDNEFTLLSPIKRTTTRPRTGFGFDRDIGRLRGRTGSILSHHTDSFDQQQQQEQSQSTDTITTSTSFCVLQRLLDLYPDSIRIPNGQGKLPFRIAMENGNRDTAKELLAIFPPAMERSGVSDTLFPFLLEQISSNKKEKNTNDSLVSSGGDSLGGGKSEDMNRFKLAFQLIRQRPNLMAHG